MTPSASRTSDPEDDVDVTIIVKAETDDAFTCDAMVAAIESTAPYMFDNVIVHSQVTDTAPAVDLEALGSLIRALLPRAVVYTDPDNGELQIATGLDTQGRPHADTRD